MFETIDLLQQQPKKLLLPEMQQTWNGLELTCPCRLCHLTFIFSTMARLMAFWSYLNTVFENISLISWGYPDRNQYFYSIGSLLWYYGKNITLKFKSCTPRASFFILTHKMFQQFLLLRDRTFPRLSADKEYRLELPTDCHHGRKTAIISSSKK